MDALWPTAEEWSAVRLSLLVAAWATIVTAGPGIALGWVLARKRFPGHAALDAMVHLPLVLPPVAIGYLLLLALGRSGPIGGLLEALGLPIAFTWRAAVVASAVMAFPLMVRSVRLAIELVDPALEDAAATLGATPARVVATITLPLALPGILAGAVLSFARSLGEFGATIIIAGNIAGQTRTLPLALFSELQVPGADAERRALRLVVIAVLLSVAALGVSEALARRARRRLTGGREA